MRRARRKFYYDAQDGLCALRRSLECREVGGLMSKDQCKRSPRRPTWDHIIPRGEGGKDERNILLACSQCNHERGIHPAPDGAKSRAETLWEAWLVYRAEHFPHPPARTTRKQGAPVLPYAGKSYEENLAAVLDLEDEIGRREIRAARNRASYASARRHVAENKKRLGRN